MCPFLILEEQTFPIKFNNSLDLNSVAGLAYIKSSFSINWPACISLEATTPFRINNKLSFDGETPKAITISSSGNYFYYFPNPEDIYIEDGINTWVSFVNYEETYRKQAKSSNSRNINSEVEINNLKIARKVKLKR